MSCSRNVFMGREHTEMIPHRQRSFFRLPENTQADNIPRMTESIQDRIRSLIETSGKAAKAISREAGLDKETLRKLLSNPEQKPSAKTLSGLASVFGVSEQWLLKGDEDSQPPPVRQEAENLPSLPARQSMPLDVPVMGTAAGSLARGAFQLEGSVIDYVRRPPALTGARDIYALFVEGSSMEPQYFPGDLIYINPHRPPRVGDVVVVQCRNGEYNPDEASLGIYRKRTEKVLVIGKRNPAAEVEFNRDHVKAVHRVLTTNELFGV